MIKHRNWLVSAVVLGLLAGCTDNQEATEQAEVSRPVPMLVVGASDQASNLRFPGRVRAAQRADLAFNVAGQVIELPA